MTLQSQKRHNKLFLWQRIVLAIIAFLLLSSAAIIWILNVQGIVGGSWSSSLGVIFTLLGVLFALFQWLLPFPSGVSETSVATQNNSYRRKISHIQVEGVDLGISKDKGALIVYAKRGMRGKTIHLMPGYVHMDDVTPICVDITKQIINGRVIYAAIFPSLEPGNYTVAKFSLFLLLAAPRSSSAKDRYLMWDHKHVTVSSKNCAQVDWT